MNSEVEIKQDGIFISLTDDVIEDLERSAELRGMEISDFLISLINEVIDEERENHPQVFEREIEVDDTRLVYADGAGTVDADEIN